MDRNKVLVLNTGIQIYGSLDTGMFLNLGLNIVNKQHYDKYTEEGKTGHYLEGQGILQVIGDGNINSIDPNKYTDAQLEAMSLNLTAEQCDLMIKKATKPRDKYFIMQKEYLAKTNVPKA